MNVIRDLIVSLDNFIIDIDTVCLFRIGIEILCVLVGQRKARVFPVRPGYHVRYFPNLPRVKEYSPKPL